MAYERLSGQQEGKRRRRSDTNSPAVSQEQRLDRAIVSPCPIAANVAPPAFQEHSLHLALQPAAADPGRLPHPLEVILHLAQTSGNSALSKLPRYPAGVIIYFLVEPIHTEMNCRCILFLELL